MSLELEPFDISRIVYAPGRKIHGFWMKLSNIPGALFKVLKPIVSCGANLLYLTTPPETGKIASCFFVADFTETSIEPSQLADELRRIDVVLEVGIIEPTLPGLVGDKKHFPLTVLGGRVAVFRKPVLKGLILGVKEKFGSAGDVFLYYAGRSLGKSVAENYSGIHRGSARELVEVLSLFAQTLSWCIIEVEEWNEEKLEFTLKVFDSFECEIGKGSNRRFSQLIRGTLSGFFTELLKVEMEAEELDCIAISDPFCRFLVKKAR